VTLGIMGLLLSDLLYRWIRRRGLTTRLVHERVFHTAALSVSLGAAAGLVTSAAGIAPWQTADLQVDERLHGIAVLAIHALNWMLLLLIWSVAYFSLRALRERAAARLRESELARALHLAELRLLKSQLNPHFLFNALNTVRALIAEDPTRAQEAVTQLARTLRYTLGASQEELVTLERELAIVDDYLAIEALRLGDRLHLVRGIAPTTRTVRIPTMLLQMLVENAIKHGIAELPQGGVLRICSQLEAETLILTVENARPRSSPPALGRGSIGLRNSAERLRLLFGARARVDLDVTQPGWAVARVCIPCN
jgi:LytS/YehU family sensor histidine kinase